MQPSAWDDVRRIADEVELQIHVGGMEARGRWHALQPRLSELEKALAATGRCASYAVDHEISSLWVALQRLREDVEKRNS